MHTSMMHHLYLALAAGQPQTRIPVRGQWGREGESSRKPVTSHQSPVMGKVPKGTGAGAWRRGAGAGVKGCLVEEKARLVDSSENPARTSERVGGKQQRRWVQKGSN